MNADEEMLGKARPVDPNKVIDEGELLGRSHAPQLSLAREEMRVGVTATPEERFAELEEMCEGYLGSEDMRMIRRAFRFANAAHKGQCRKSGEPFVIHPVEVAIILADLRMDAETICAALLHDTVEDTETTTEDVVREFNEAVAQLVQGVTKITQVEVESLTDEQAATIRKMFVAMSKDIRVIVIKLADRLHNMRTLGALKEDRRIFKSRETMEVYAPIAHRLGINSIKWELEDLSFFYLEPNKYKQVSRMVLESRAEREAYLAEVVSILHAEMEKIGVNAQIMGRPKHLWSIYQKMVKKGKGFSEIYDLIAVRIIVESVRDCYSALGAVHALWHPMPGRFKDYIAMPKYNMYQSLHTTVMGPTGRPLEAQIRTEDMHHSSEYGVAAHWRYKEGGKGRDESFERQLAWLRQMIDNQDESQDSREFLKDLKVDLAPTEVFVFTPKGEVMSLRAGSTPIDFAYAIHTEVGNHCVGAKVNGSIVPITYELQQGDRIEILTQKSASPTRDWLNIVKTPSARNKIRAYLGKVSRSDDLVEGRDRLAREMKKHSIGISNAHAQKAIRNVADSLGYRDADNMFVCIGTGKESAQHVANRLLKILVDRGNEEDISSVSMTEVSTGVMAPMLTSVMKPKRHETHSETGVVVKGIDDVLVRLSRCCHPVPGDDIVGFVTRGRGVSVHRRDCPNAQDLLKEPERILEVEWEQTLSKRTSFQVEVYVQGLDRMNLLRDVTMVISEAGANVTSCTTTTHRDGIFEMNFVFQVSDIKTIEFLLKKLREVDGVFEATRSTPTKRKNGKE